MVSFECETTSYLHDFLIVGDFKVPIQAIVELSKLPSHMFLVEFVDLYHTFF
jgi:hypothetical protein